MHIPYEPQILLVLRSLTYGRPPFLDELQDLIHRPRGSNRRPLRKSTHEFIEELLRTDLQLEWVSTVLDADVEQLSSVSISEPLSVWNVVPKAQAGRHSGCGY